MILTKKHPSCSQIEFLIPTETRILIVSLLLNHNFLSFSDHIHDNRVTVFVSVNANSQVNFLREGVSGVFVDHVVDSIGWSLLQMSKLSHRRKMHIQLLQSLHF